MTRTIVLPVVLGALIACRREPAPEMRVGEHIAVTCPPASREDYYFPSNAFDGFTSTNDRGESFQTDQEFRLLPDQMLWSMHEPSLSCGPQPDSYRFIWIQTSSPQAKPTMIRASGDLQRGGELTYIRLGGLFDLTTASYKEVERRTRPLTASDWSTLDLSIRKAEFWRLHTAPSDPSSPEDGGIWIVEGRRAAGYHVVARYGGNEENLGAAADALVKLAGIDLTN